MDIINKTNTEIDLASKTVVPAPHFKRSISSDISEDCNKRKKNYQNNLWRRPQLKNISNSDSLTFQQMSLDHYIGNSIDKSNVNCSAPITRMFGIMSEGHSICCNVHGFYPYFYISAPDNFERHHCSDFMEKLNIIISNDMNNHTIGIKRAIIAIDLAERINLYGYRGDEFEKYLKITTALPKFIYVIQTILKNNCIFALFAKHKYEIFEANINYDMRFMVDLQIVGCSWIELPTGSYTTRNSNSLPIPQSTCQLEIDVFCDKIISHAPNGEWSKIAPFRILSFDIECAGRKGIFPEPDKDPVIQIANVVRIENNNYIRNVFTLNTCAPIADTQVISCDDEITLLEKWSEFVRICDPDIITGYNINNFDLPYLLNRGKHLRANNFSLLGRVKNIKSEILECVVQSKQLGYRRNNKINIDGRVIFDLYLILTRDYKLRSYSLNSVSYHFLQEQKEDVHHSIITDLQNGTCQSRRRLAVYCLKDASLPLKLLDKLMCLINYMEMARVTGVSLGNLVMGGQQTKVMSQLLRLAIEKKFILPTIDKKITNDQFEGATVIEPIKGYYTDPITTLDFISLYPSIMIAHNLCYTTLVSRKTINRLNLAESEYEKTPSGNFFVTDSKRKGLLPEILEKLLSARKKAKMDLKFETDTFKRKVLDGRQLALKMSANSVYGFTGAQIGKLPCLDISTSVTAYGRTMIELTKQGIENRFSISNNYEYNATVIYGDTDSVMVKFGVKSVEKAMDLGREAAEFISKIFKNPIKLDFEKVYHPYLLINKKRYAGLSFTNTDKYDTMDCKGLETVRRDNSPLVSNVINNCLHKLLINKDPDGAIAYVKQIISDLLCDRIDISQLIITKELSKSEYVAKQAHVELARIMAKRDPGNAPKLGDRIPYVLIKGAKNTPAYQLAEDPIFVLENHIPINVHYYLTNQLSKPLIRIFSPILGNKTESVLLKGDHTREKILNVSKIGALSAFTQKKETCLGCKCILQDNDSDKALCKYCIHNQIEIYYRELDKVNDLQEKFCSLWTECQRCQKSLHDEVICTNKDCPIFYMRKKIQIELISKTNVMNRLN